VGTLTTKDGSEFSLVSPASTARPVNNANVARSGCAAIALALLLSLGCNTAGRTALSGGRGTYNTVINRTEDEQILSMIVCQRYNETYGLLSVSSVTTNIKVGASLGANVGIGSDSSYAGNLVPFAAGATVEENPTISYVPLRGEQFVGRLLATLSAEHALLLGRMSGDLIDAFRVFVRRANGLVNPAYDASPEGARFDRFIALYARLRDEGVLDIVRVEDGAYELLFHDASPEQTAPAAELLRELGIQRTLSAGGELRVPLRFFVGSARGEGLDLETPSALEVIQAAGEGIEVPEEHLTEGIAHRSSLDESRHFLTVHSSSRRASHASVAVEYRDYWFFIDARDARSKQSFMLVRTLIGLRLDDPTGQHAPVLTVPVGG